VGETAEVTLKLIGSVDKVFCCKKNAEKGRTVIVNLDRVFYGNAGRKDPVPCESNGRRRAMGFLWKQI
jgi:hypothetical protein